MHLINRIPDFLRFPLFFLGLVLLVSLVTTVTARSQTPVPAPNGAWIIDDAGVLSAADKVRVNDRLRAFEQARADKPQMVAFILKSMPEQGLEDYANQVFKTWKVGQKGVDNGAVWILVPSARQMRLEPGSGLEGAITDATASRINVEAAGPLLKQGKYADAIIAVADRLAREIDPVDDTHVQQVAQAQSAAQHQKAYLDKVHPNQGLSVGTVMLWIILFAIVFAGVVLLLHRRDMKAIEARRKQREDDNERRRVADADSAKLRREAAKRAADEAERNNPHMPPSVKVSVGDTPVRPRQTFGYAGQRVDRNGLSVDPATGVSAAAAEADLRRREQERQQERERMDRERRARERREREEREERERRRRRDDDSSSSTLGAALGGFAGGYAGSSSGRSSSSSSSSDSGSSWGSSSSSSSSSSDSGSSYSGGGGDSSGGGSSDSY